MIFNGLTEEKYNLVIGFFNSIQTVPQYSDNVAQH